jgi:hypothetical protein
MFEFFRGLTARGYATLCVALVFFVILKSSGAQVYSIVHVAFLPSLGVRRHPSVRRKLSHLNLQGGTVGHNCERDHPCQVWFNLVQWFQRKRFKCGLLSKYA